MSTPDDSVTPSPTVEPRRVDQLWFNDGTLVLVTHTSLFRIYAGLLAKESPVFHDMLQLPQPENGETMDGCPVVHLQDNGHDVEYFLKALFDYKFFLPFPSPTDFDTISGIIRLSKKYEVEALLKRALVHLASAFPTAPAEYPGSSSWKLDDQEIRVVLFARELALEWILPVAFYCVCAKGSIEDILEGVYLANARVDLNPLDKRACLRQHTLLRTSTSAEMVDFLWDPSKIDGCRNQPCTATRIAKRKEVEGWRANNLPLTLWIEGDWVGFNVCDTCMSKMKIAHQTALDKFWEGLPQRFGLPAWDELKETRKNALGN